MVLMPGKAGGAAPDGGTTGSGHSPLLPFAGPPSALPSSRRAPVASSSHVVHVPVTPQPHGQATTGNGHVCEMPPAHPEGSWHSFWDQIRGLRVPGGGRKKKTQPPKNEIGLNILKWMRKQQEEDHIMALVKRSGPRALSHHHKMSAHLKKTATPQGSTPTGVSYGALPI